MNAKQRLFIVVLTGISTFMIGLIVDNVKIAGLGMFLTFAPLLATMYILLDD